MQLSVRIPIYDRSLMQLAAAASGVASPNSPGTSSSPNGGKGNPFIGSGAGEVSDQPSIASWEMWDTIRTICEYNVRLSLSKFWCHQRAYHGMADMTLKLWILHLRYLLIWLC